jgi:hypothetical protein
MSDPFRQHAAQMPFGEGNYPVEAFTSCGADHAFAIGVRLGAITGVFSTRNPMEWSAPSTAGE